ncbi:MAG: universal stress protein [Desulfotignum sp.]|jgi:nucleotide-binding universal stress UspA family protein|nr:universal stress protein [Desulfotignum sp.]
MDTNKILVAIDGSENSKRAVEYVAEIVKGCRDFEITLLHIERLPDRDIFPDEDAWKKACAAHRQKIEDFLSDNKQMIADYGIPQKMVYTDYVESCHSPLAEDPAYCSRGTSIAQDILHVAEKAHFGTVVIGRRGVSKAEEFMFGSVSNKIIHSGNDCTVWVVQ